MITQECKSAIMNEKRALKKQIIKHLPPIGTILIETVSGVDRDVIIRGYNINPTSSFGSYVWVSKSKHNGDWSKVEHRSFDIKLKDIWDNIKM